MTRPRAIAAMSTISLMAPVAAVKPTLKPPPAP
jgi:hypothetical protein